MTTFDITGIVAKFQDDQPAWKRCADTLFSHYDGMRQKTNADPSLRVRLGNLPPLEGEWVASGGGRVRLRQDGIMVSGERYKSARWSFQMTGIGSRELSVSVDSNFTGRMFVTGNVVDFAIQERMLRRGTPMIHAAAVATDRGAILLAGRGGAGKTTLSSAFLEEGASFISDNYTVLCNGEAHGVPTALSLFSYNASDSIRAKLTDKQRREMWVKKAIYRSTGGYAKIFTKVGPAQVYSRTKANAPLQTIVFLRPTWGKKAPALTRVNPSEAAASTTANQRLEFPYWNRYIAESAYAFPTGPLANHWEVYKAALLQEFTKVPLWALEFDPRTLGVQRAEVTRMLQEVL